MNLRSDSLSRGSWAFSTCLLLLGCRDGAVVPHAASESATRASSVSPAIKRETVPVPGKSGNSSNSSPTTDTLRTTAPAVATHLPLDLAIGQFEDVPLAGDRALRVAHAREGLTQSIIYLHGMCGNSQGADRFADLLTSYGTVIVVRGNVPCEDRPGYRWPQEPEEIEPRIRSALAHVAQLRNGQLNTEESLLFGYSQGAHRGEKLAQAYPERYRELILGGPPTAPTPEKLVAAKRVAILGGEMEDTAHMTQGDADLRAAGVSSQFFLLPGAHHGDYGPQGVRVLKEVLAWTLGPPLELSE